MSSTRHLWLLALGVLLSLLAWAVSYGVQLNAQDALALTQARASAQQLQWQTAQTQWARHHQQVQHYHTVRALHAVLMQPNVQTTQLNLAHEAQTRALTWTWRATQLSTVDDAIAALRKTLPQNPNPPQIQHLQNPVTSGNMAVEAQLKWPL